jgi:MFS family permease
MFPLFAETFSLSSSQVHLITGATVIVLGFSNFVVIPFSNIFGRRAASLTFGILFLATCIWQAAAKSYGSFMASRAIIGIAAAPSETLMAQVVADMFFLHERGLWMGVFLYARDWQYQRKILICYLVPRFLSGRLLGP